jgi:uncharacterized protein
VKTRQFAIWATWALLPFRSLAQDLPAPIIDVHLHALRANDQGPPPLSFCTQTAFPPVDTGSSWPAAFMAWFKNPPCEHPIQSPVNDNELMLRTLAIMKRRNIIGVTSGPLVNQ